MALGVLGGPSAIGSHAPRRRRDRRALGALSGTMAMPSGLCAFFPYECKNWSQYTTEQQQQIAALHKQKMAQLNAEVYSYKQQGACDGTKPGRLAGQMRESLIAAGGDASKMGTDDAAFGPKECAEWWRVAGREMTIEDARSAIGKTWFGSVPITLDTICGTAVKLPTCPKPAPPVVAPPAVTTTYTPAPYVAPAKPKMSTANMLVAGGVIAALSVGGYYVAKKKGWIKT